MVERGTGRGVEVPGLDDRGCGIGVIHNPPVGRPCQSIGHGVTLRPLLHPSIGGDTIQPAQRLAGGVFVHAPDPKGAIRPNLAVVEAVGGGFVDNPRQAGHNPDARVEQYHAMPLCHHQPAGFAQAEASHDFRKIPGFAGAGIDRQRVDALGGDVAEQKPPLRRIPGRAFRHAAAAVPDQFECAHGSCFSLVRW